MGESPSSGRKLLSWWLLRSSRRTGCRPLHRRPRRHRDALACRDSSASRLPHPDLRRQLVTSAPCHRSGRSSSRSQPDRHHVTTRSHRSCCSRCRYRLPDATRMCRPGHQSADPLRSGAAAGLVREPSIPRAPATASGSDPCRR